MKSFDHICETNNNINFIFPIRDYCKKGENVASLYLYESNDDIKRSGNGKVKVSL